MHEALGIGRAALLNAEALREEGFSVVTEDLRSLQRGLLTRPAGAMPEGDHNCWLIHANPPEARMALFARQESQWRGLYRIGYWAWESDLAPASWLDCAAYFHELWVPSPFVAEAFARAFAQAGMAGQSAKLRVVPHPVAVPDLAARRSGGPVRVLTLFDPRSSFERKNPAGAISAWIQAFPESSDRAELVVKSLAGAEVYPEFARLKQLVGGRADIDFVCETLDAVAQQAFLQNGDVVLSLHRAEGFGLPLAEAMAAGLAVIATEGTGNGSFMSGETAILIPGRPVPASPLYNGPGARWLEPDIGAAADALRRLVADAELRQGLGQRARDQMKMLRRNWKI